MTMLNLLALSPWSHDVPFFFFQAFPQGAGPHGTRFQPQHAVKGVTSLLTWLATHMLIHIFLV